VCADEPVGLELAVRHLPEVLWCRNVRRVGVHVVDPEEEPLLPGVPFGVGPAVGFLDELRRLAFDVEQPRGVGEGARPRTVAEPVCEPPERRRRDLEPGVYRRVGRQVPLVTAQVLAADERFELVEPPVVPPVAREKSVARVEPARPHSPVPEGLRQRRGLRQADVVGPGEDRLRREDTRKRERRPVPVGERVLEHRARLREPTDLRGPPVLGRVTDRVRSQRVDRDEHDVRHRYVRSHIPVSVLLAEKGDYPPQRFADPSLRARSRVRIPGGRYSHPGFAGRYRILPR